MKKVMFARSPLELLFTEDLCTKVLPWHNIAMLKSQFFISTLLILFLFTNLPAQEAISSQLPSPVEEEHPILNLSDYYIPEKKAQFVSSLHRSCTHYGAFVLRESGVRPALLEEARQGTVNFFKQDMLEKTALSAKSLHEDRGYMEARDGYEELFLFGRELGRQQKPILGYPPNRWPENIDLKGPLYRVFKELEACLVPVQHGLASALHLPINTFNELTRDGDAMLRAQVDSDGIQGALSDTRSGFARFSVLTALVIYEEGIVELSGASERAMHVNVMPGDLLVLVGDVLELLSNGIYTAPSSAVLKGKPAGIQIGVALHPRNTDLQSPLSSCVELSGVPEAYSPLSREGVLH